ncbi:MAG: abortive infection protein [Burkholderiaceae bacterium]|jgi:hypothetical protein|nr:abortive infection protein [Burkholderiaceae bacterium]
MSPVPVTAVPPPGLPRLSWRIFAVLWLLGLPGVAAVAWLVLPGWMQELGLPVGLMSTPLTGIAVMSLLLTLPVALGVRLGPSVGLSAPLLTTWIAGRSPQRAVRYLLLPGVAGGVVGAAWLVTLALVWPDNLAQIDPVYVMPLGAKLLYAGITAELVMRLGGMTLVMWLLWRWSGRTDRRPGWLLGWWSVMLSSLLWAGLQLVLAWHMWGGLSDALLVQLLLFEVVHGAVAGFLFWRYGLEAAMLAHAITYLLSHGLV